MNDDLEFRFSVPRIPEGEALTFDEIEARFRLCMKGSKPSTGSSRPGKLIPDNDRRTATTVRSHDLPLDRRDTHFDEVTRLPMPVIDRHPQTFSFLR